MSMSNITDKIASNIDVVIRKKTIDLFKSIIMMTPVGDPSQWAHPEWAPPDYVGGHARLNWQASVGSPITQEIDGVDPEGSIAVARVMETVKSGAVNYLCNNVPYISRLEYDVPPHSRQAPKGMVRISIQRFGLGEIV